MITVGISYTPSVTICLGTIEFCTLYLFTEEQDVEQVPHSRHNVGQTKLISDEITEFFN
jgi:hypothetical protein